MASIEGAVSRDESGTDKDALSSDPSADAGAGVSKLTDGAEELDGGAAELLDGIDELDGGVVELLGGTDELDEEAAELLGGTDAELDMELFKEELDELVILSVCGAEEELALDATELFELSELAELLSDFCSVGASLWQAAQDSSSAAQSKLDNILFFFIVCSSFWERPQCRSVVFQYTAYFL